MNKEEGMDMRVHFYYGDYSYRQLRATEEGVDFYLEHHFASDLRGTGNECVVMIPKDSVNPDIAKSFAYEYAKRVADEFKVNLANNTGVIQISEGHRGAGSICKVKAPAALVEPLFISNIQHVQMLMSGGLDKLAEILAECLKLALCKVKDPLVGFSVGHKYKRSAPYDRGAHTWGKPEYSEADLAEIVLRKAECLLKT